MIDRAFSEAARYVTEGRIPGATLGIVTADGRREVRVAGLAQRVPVEAPLTRDHSAWRSSASAPRRAISRCCRKSTSSNARSIPM